MQIGGGSTMQRTPKQTVPGGHGLGQKAIRVGRGNRVTSRASRNGLGGSRTGFTGFGGGCTLPHMSVSRARSSSISAGFDTTIRDASSTQDSLALFASLILASKPTAYLHRR